VISQQVGQLFLRIGKIRFQPQRLAEMNGRGGKLT